MAYDFPLQPDLESFPPADCGKLQELARAVETFHLVVSAAELGVFDCLDEPKKPDELAETIGLQKNLTKKFCNSLVASGFLEQNGTDYVPSEFTKTFLTKKSPFYQGNMLGLLKKTRNERWSNLTEVMKKGPVGFDGGINRVFDEQFIYAMAEGAMRGSLQKTIGFMKNYPGFLRARSLLDLGGGHGLYSIAFTRVHPDLQATIFDLPPVVERVINPMISRYNAERVTAIPGDFTKDALGSEYDMIFASDVLYRERNQLDAILGRIHSGLANDGILVSKHWHIDDIVRDATAVNFDLMFSLAEDSDRIYSSRDFSEVLGSNGFEVETRYDLDTPFHPSRIIISRKVRA